MIRTDDNQFIPGSVIPDIPTVSLADNDLIQEYLLSASWEFGEGLLILGFAGTGKTTMGISVLREIAKVSPLEMIYWTEHDFLADLRNLWRMEEMTQKYSRDDALWKEYLDWERTFWNLKESPFLFLDEVGRGYTAMHTYEVENLLRFRESKKLATVVASQSLNWENLSPSLKSVVERHSMIVRL